jgi:hypothetical protein
MTRYHCYGCFLSNLTGLARVTSMKLSKDNMY